MSKYIESSHSNIWGQSATIIILIGAAILRWWCLTIEYKTGTMGDFIKIIVINKFNDKLR